MTEREMEMFEERLFDRVARADFAHTVAQETAENIIIDLKNYIAECGHITKSMLDELIERYAFDYGVEVEGDEVEIDPGEFKDCEVKNEKVKQNMKNVLEIEKKNAVKEFAEKLKAKAHSVVGFDVLKKVYAKEYTIDEIDINELLKEYEQ